MSYTKYYCQCATATEEQDSNNFVQYYGTLANNKQLHQLDSNQEPVNNMFGLLGH